MRKITKENIKEINKEFEERNLLLKQEMIKELEKIKENEK
jgi:hypothetical protein